MHVQKYWLSPPAIEYSLLRRCGTREQYSFLLSVDDSYIIILLCIII